MPIEWTLLSSLPDILRDGSDVLLWCGDHAKVGSWISDTLGFSGWIDVEAETIEPTHFAVLHPPTE